ncbi:sciellin isoform x3 [Limosa lapponica baueri]|uniref:Sciellin isoform x3 n=1 Tax=Limosa lapponica baueri TaxID=1758121 RepID=A0A2I0TMQ8_LIMLA|nr:sciellin isoform x3 [Limosa lapponica baueri]
MYKVQKDNKSPSVAIKSRQQANHDVNKRRTLLQDNSWIKKRPEEESADENYGRAVLNQYKSQDSLHSSSTNEKEDQKAALGRYRSDTTLDRTTSENSEAPTTAAISSEQVTPQKSKTDVDDQATTRSIRMFVRRTRGEAFEVIVTGAMNQDLDNLIKVNSSSFTSDKDKSSYGAYEENITGNTIKTVYSTSDRSIIGKDICTYCRKPLGIDAKMILDALQICCHSTCFKCEVCKRPLEDLKAGDSIWIYRQTVHCEPCYSKVKAEKDFLDMIMTELECSEAAGPEQELRRVKSAKAID